MNGDNGDNDRQEKMQDHGEDEVEPPTGEIPALILLRVPTYVKVDDRE